MALHLPEAFYRFNILGLDPGITTTGISVYEIDTRLPGIRRIVASTLWNHKLGNWNEYDPETHVERVEKLLKLRYALTQWLWAYNPVVVGCEAPFFNRLMPMAYGSLLSLVSALQHAVYEYNPNIGFHLVEPQLVKKSIGVAGKKGKDVVREAIAQIPEIANVLDPALPYLDEHAIDAVAVVHTLIKYKLPPLWGAAL